MVDGIEIFKEFFADYKEQYVLIGGAACDIFIENSTGTFRATKDLDIVLIVEALTTEFGQTFWRFIKEGAYGNTGKSSGEPRFYRFEKPGTVGYPYMIELFAKQSFLLGDKDGNLTPLHISDDVSSLSAILLNESYYQMLLSGREEVEEIMVLSPVYIIPFKAKAWLDLNEKQRNGIQIDSKDIKKHRNDIVRLAAIFGETDKITLPAEVRNDMEQFIAAYEKTPVDIKSLRIKDITNEMIIEKLKQIYL